MAINPGTNVYGASDTAHALMAVLDVDINHVPVNDPNAVSAKALVVTMASGSPVPTGGATSALQGTLNTAIGSPTDAAWDGSAASASLISIMKAIWVKLPGV